MLNTGYFPDNLKIAEAIHIFKKEDQSLCNNYRPISLLPAISKIFEKVIFKQLYDYSPDNNLFYLHQYGFRSGHSTEMAVLETIDRISIIAIVRVAVSPAFVSLSLFFGGGSQKYFIFFI